MLAASGLLVFACIVVSRFLNGVGIPALVVFLAVGMLAGSDGPGGIHFDNAVLANLVGTVALAFILFSGGIDTNWNLIRPVFVPALLLSTVGVILTAGLVGLFVWGVLGYSATTAFLIGAIISSTDAAAVFAVLRGKGIGLQGNLKSLLELESGSNDPVAIFLTLGMTQILTVPNFDWTSLLPLFALNMLTGVAVGLAMGSLARVIFNRVRLDQEGLYPVLSLSLMLITFGAAELLRGNGFLAVYLCGIWLNRADFTHKRAVVRFHDGMAWLMQILMFIVLGMLVFPSQLAGVALGALLIAMFLILVARPVAVWATLWHTGYNNREKTFIAWTGLRGAVPIVLATFPLMAGYEHSPLVFNIVFFIVLTSVLVQGTLLNRVARWLGVDAPLDPQAAFHVEIERGGHTQGDTREVQVLPDTVAAGNRIVDLELPAGINILLIGRGDQYIVPRGETYIDPYDTLLLFGKPDMLRAAVEKILTPPPRSRRHAPLDSLATLPLTTDERLLTHHTVVVRYGRVGKIVCESLAKRGLPYVVVDNNPELIKQLRAKGVAAVLGDAASPMTLAQAHVARAAVLAITALGRIDVQDIIDIARTLNPEIKILIRTNYANDTALPPFEGDTTLICAEQETADGIVRDIVGYMRARAQDAR